VRAFGHTVKILPEVAARRKGFLSHVPVIASEGAGLRGKPSGGRGRLDSGVAGDRGGGGWNRLCPPRQWPPGAFQRWAGRLSELAAFGRD